jgi:triacylglycerol lipase
VSSVERATIDRPRTPSASSSARLRSIIVKVACLVLATGAFAPTSHDAAVPTRVERINDLPVILVPGWLDSARELAAMRIHLLGAGWPTDGVATVTFREPTGSNREHADELEAAIEALVAASASDRVDVVAHSMGGLATRWYLLTRGGGRVRRVVFLGSPHRGTLSAHLAWGGGREEMMPNSAFLDSLNSAQPTPAGVDAITIRTLIDTRIVPGESATLPGVPDYPLCCPTHAGLLRDPDVFEIVHSFLESGVVPQDGSVGPGA